MCNLDDGTPRWGIYCVECSGTFGDYIWPCTRARTGQDRGLPRDQRLVTAGAYETTVGRYRTLLTEVIVAVFDSRPTGMSDDLWARLLAAAPKPDAAGEPAAEEAGLF